MVTNRVGLPTSRALTAEEAIEYLQFHVQKSVCTDVFPLTWPEFGESGYFAVPRLVLAYADFLGCLYTGNRKGKNGQPLTSQSAVLFIRRCFGDVASAYRRRGGLLYEMYRHGTVHIYEPKVVETAKGAKLAWLVGKTIGALGTVGHHHMWKRRRHLAVSQDRLADDLLLAIEVYIHKLSSRGRYLARFNRAWTDIHAPEKETDLRRKKRYLRPSDF